MQTAPATNPLSPGRGVPLPARRGVCMASLREFAGVCRATVYRIHADEMASGREGVLLKVGRSTLLDVPAWDRYLARQPRPVLRSDRPRAAA